MLVKAPGVIKLLGEHAVVYGYTCIAVAIDLYVNAEPAATGDNNALAITNSSYGLKKTVSKEEVSKLFEQHEQKSSMQNYVDRASAMVPGFMHFATIASQLYCNYGVSPFGKSITLEGNLPSQRGLASSAASSTAFLLSLLDDAELPETTLIDLARYGERVIHRNANAGTIDVSTSFYGGCVRYDSKNGARKESLGKEIDLLIVDTGPKKSTAEMVGHVARLYCSNQPWTEGVFGQIEDCSKEGIEALNRGDTKTLGECMYQDHSLLAQLGVSTPNLDKVVEIAKNNHAPGAKLSGGGGGGTGIVLLDNSTQKEAMIEEFRRKGFELINAKITRKGAYDYFLEGLKEK
jgi:mevalonate kinase